MQFRHWLILTFLFVLGMLGDSIYTLQSTFYPKIAESKNATTFQYTIVFGVFEGTVAIASPFFGSMNMDPRLSFIFGNLLQGASVLLFGFVNHFSSLRIFLGCSILLRILQGLGLSVAFVGMYSLIPLLFPVDKTAFIMGVLEMCVPLGFLIGPICGSLLYKFGGFTLPFFATGATITIFALIIPFITKSRRRKSQSSKSPRDSPTEDLKCNSPTPEVESEVSLQNLLAIPSVAVNFLVIFGMAVGFGVMFGILEPFLRHEFQATETTIGTIFGITGLLYSVFSPLVGLMGEERMKYLHRVIFWGLVVDLLGISLVGPLPILPLDINFTRTCIGMVVFGLGTGVSTFSAYLNAIRESKLHGFSTDDSRTLSLVTGLYLSCFATGSMVSSPVAGYLYDIAGFRTALYFPVVCIIILMMLVSSIKFNKQKHRYSVVNVEDLPQDVIAMTGFK